jgi:ATP-dependent Clp protease ATP-binding subunit ClpB
VEAELAELKEEATALRAVWMKEKEGLKDVKSLKERIEALRHDAEMAQRRGDFEGAAKIQYGDLFNLENELKEKEAHLEEKGGTENRFLREEVTEEDIAKVVARWTGIPVSKMLESEAERLLQMEDRLAERVVGQAEAIEAVSHAIRRSRAGLSDERRPIGSFLFLGPTGVGKTELGRALAEFMFDDETAMVRIDMSEYMEKHAVARLIGAPPGYIGYEEGGQLTERVRRRPYSVVLLDEMEKAHPEVFNVLLQLLDDGRLTDGQGRTVDFRNTVILMTSNVGSHHLLEGVNDESRTRVMMDLKAKFRPEFLNRVDDTIMFHGLTREDLAEIVGIQLALVEERLANKRIHLTVEEPVKELLVREGFDPAYGARPLKRIIQKRVVDQMAKALLRGDFSPDQKVRVFLDDGAVAFEGLSDVVRLPHPDDEAA